VTDQILRGTLEGMKLLDHDEADCQVRRSARRTIQTYRRWVEEHLRFHHDRAGRWDIAERLTHTAFTSHVVGVETETSRREAVLEVVASGVSSSATYCGQGR
jgi:hypothetical protein